MDSRVRARARVAVGSIALAAVAACGEAFTSNDGGTLAGPDASFDTGIPDAEREDVKHPRDAESRDGSVDDGGGQVDTGGPGSDGGPIDAASLCLKTCPSGFDCLAGKCVDRAGTHFGVANVTSNWSYGSFASFGSSPFVTFGEVWATNGIVFSSRTKNALAPSVFHTLTSASYAGMNVPAGTLGLYPGPTMGVDTNSVVRWTAPAAGHYAIAATFTGLGTTPLTMVNTNVNIGGAVGSGHTINAFGGMNTVDYANADQMMMALGTIDFYIGFATMADDLQGGTALDVRITAN